MIEAVAPEPRLARVQLIDWLGTPQLKSPLIESTMRRGSTASTRVRLSASDAPLLVTVMVKVWLAVPAVTGSSPKAFVTVRTTSSTMATSSVALSAPPSSDVASAVLSTDGSASVAVSTL